MVGPITSRVNIRICIITHQRSAVSVLRAAGGKARAAPAPFDIGGSEGGRGTTALPLARPQEPGQGRGGQEQQGYQGGQGGHGHWGDTQAHVAADRADITHLQHMKISRLFKSVDYKVLFLAAAMFIYILMIENICIKILVLCKNKLIQLYGDKKLWRVICPS